MWPEDLFINVLETFAEELIRRSPPHAAPMPCDRWLARSALQKAIRRGEVDAALAALATLFAQHPQGVWRDLTIIAIEDVGVAGMDTVARAVAAGRDRSWRSKVGGDWAVASALVKRMAEDLHCQAVCDLLMRAVNDPRLEALRADVLEAKPAELVRRIVDEAEPLVHRAAAALALGGGLADEQRFRQPGAVFEAYALASRSEHVTATAHAAWKLSRNPMALLLPLVWTEWMNVSTPAVADDDLLPTLMVGGVPAYALDQFTRGGLAVARALVTADPKLRIMLDAAGTSLSQRHRIIGDIIFLLEGGKVKNRAIWPEADRLRLPHRPLPAVFKLGPHIDDIMAHMASKGTLIEELRERQQSHHDRGECSTMV